jgi:Na+-transporting methylmalonyl-CoA/oxaloacetate decarboxylase gamma subunit
MGRLRIDWIQFVMLMLTLLAAAVHVEGRLSSIEQHLVDQDRAADVLRQRVEDVAKQVGELERRRP